MLALNACASAETLVETLISIVRVTIEVFLCSGRLVHLVNKRNNFGKALVRQNDQF